MKSPEPLSSASLEIHLFGRFRVFVEGHPLKENEIKGRKARSLLKLVAQRPNSRMARDEVLERLWPDLDREAANAQLYKALHHIRKALSGYSENADEWISITDDLIRINPPGGLVTDAGLFEETARAGINKGDRSLLERAVSIYPDEFLPMNRYAEWTSLPREHYRQLHLDVLTALAELYEDQNELSEAAEMLRRVLDKAPEMETAHRALMRIFAKKGQPTRAFHQYEVCREKLGEELGIGPSSETIRILDDIREGKLGKEKKHHDRPSSFPESTPPLIGRSDACRQFERVLEMIEEGRGQGLLICGEAGIGKTRLTRELGLRARRRDLPFLLGHSGTGNGNVAYGPFIEILDEVLHRRPELQEELPIELGRLVPAFTVEGDPAPHGDKLAAKGHLFAQVHRFLSTLSREDPVVVVLEDLHSADRGSRQLFSYLLRHIDRLPILLAATLRKEEEEPLPEFAANQEGKAFEVVELSPLTYEEHVALLQQGAGNAIIGADTSSRIYQLSEGNPLYALELLRHYMENEPPETSEDSDTADSSAPAGARIPTTLRKLVEEKLEGLSPQARHLLNIAAVIDRRIPYDLLAYIWGGEDQNAMQELFKALEEVIRVRLLEEEGLDYSFRHALVQETIYASISRARRRILHKQVAERLIESASGEEVPVEQVARHYLGAEERMKGAKYMMRAGERAESAYAHEDALQRYRKACEVLEEADDKQAGPMKMEILRRIGDVYRACGQLERSYEAYDEAISLAEDHDVEKAGLVELYRRMAVVAIFRTEIERSREYLEKAFECSGKDPQTRARLLITRALHLWHTNQLEDAYKTGKEALELAREAGAKVEISQACEILAITCLPLGRWEEGLEYEREKYNQDWSPEIVVATDAHLCLWEYHLTGDRPFQQARSFMKKIAEQATEVGDLRCVAVCHYALGTMYLWRGERRQAVRELASSLELHEQVGSPAGMAYSLARKSVLHTLAGGYDLGWQAVQQGLEYTGRAAVRDHCMQRLLGVGLWNRLEAGELEQARQVVEESEALLEEKAACGACSLELYPWMAYYYLQTGQVQRARECGKAVSALAEKTGNPIGEVIATIIESSLCLTESKRERAEECIREARRIMEEAVPDTAHSPVGHYLDRMTEQQEELA